MAEGAGQTVTIQGHVDTVSRFEVRGWAVDRADPARRLAVELLSNGRTVSIAPVRQDRADLAVLDAGRTDLGFTLPVPAGLALDFEALAVRIAGSGELLPLGKASAVLEGVVDNAYDTRVGGWAWRVGFAEERVLVTISHKGDPVANLVADLHRYDLVEAGIGDGRHAFTVDLGQLPGGRSFNMDDIDVRFEQNGRPLHDLRRQQETSRVVPAEPAPRPVPIPPAQPVAPLQPIRAPQPSAQATEPPPPRLASPPQPVRTPKPPLQATETPAPLPAVPPVEQQPPAPVTAETATPAPPPPPAAPPISSELAEALLGSIYFGDDEERLGL